MTTDPKPEDGKYNPNLGVHEDAPRHKQGPVLWMGMLMLLIVVLTTISMWGREKISVKLSPTIPELSASAQLGREIINTQCSKCHGVDGTGDSRDGPPLLHPMYRAEVYPDHHFKRVLKEGRPQTNWRFGPMPAQPQLSEEDINGVISYIREVHKATGVI